MIINRGVMQNEIDFNYPAPEFWNWVDTSGTSGNYAQLVSWVSQMGFTLDNLGKSQCGDYDLYGYGVGNPENPTVIIMPNQHGWERGGSHYAPIMMRMMRDRKFLLPRYNNLLESISVYAIVSCNPYGYEHGTRDNANGVNLNRNWTLNHNISGQGSEPFSESETKIMRDLVQSKKPICVIDHHQWGGSDKTGVGLGLNPGMNLWILDLFRSLELSHSNIPFHLWGDGTSGSLPSLDNWANTQVSKHGVGTIGLLLETINFTMNNQIKAHATLNAYLMIFLYLIDWYKNRRLIVTQ